MPTVECRSPDAALPSQIPRLAEGTNRFMELRHHTNVPVDGRAGGVSEDGISLPEFDALRDYVDQAIRRGIEPTELSAYLERMGFDVGDYEPLTRALGGRNTVSRREPRTRRLHSADLLERDVREVRAGSVEPRAGPDPDFERIPASSGRSPNR